MNGGVHCFASIVSLSKRERNSWVRAATFSGSGNDEACSLKNVGADDGNRVHTLVTKSSGPTDLMYCSYHIHSSLMLTLCGFLRFGAFRGGSDALVFIDRALCEVQYACDSNETCGPLERIGVLAQSYAVPWGN